MRKVNLLHLLAGETLSRYDCRNLLNHLLLAYAGGGPPKIPPL